MNAYVLRTMVAHEARLRLRRGSTMFALLSVIILTWLAIPDPGSGMTLMHAGDSRLIYDSTTLAVGSASLLNLLFGLGGFYLIRGRVAEDLRSGAGMVLGATPAGNFILLFGRWLGGTAYLGALAVAFMATMLVLHGLRGEAPIELPVYFQTYLLMLLPAISFASGMAVLCEACAPLIGKAGDVLYFFAWAAQLSLAAPITSHPYGGWTPLLLFDFNGAATVVARLIEIFQTTNISVGLSDFNPAAPSVSIGTGFWTWEMIVTRLASVLLCALPLLPAARLFHRFSPDSVKAMHARKRGSPLDWINSKLRPLAHVSMPLLALASRLPGAARGIAAEMALTVLSKPSFVVATSAALLAGSVAEDSILGAVVMSAVVFWGISVSDIAVRDYAVDLEALSGALEGGPSARALRQAVSTFLLGVMLAAPACLRWVEAAPLRALALVGGLFLLTALAQALGRTTRTGRTFLALFLCVMYISAQAPQVPLLDIVGAHGSATASSVFILFAGGTIAAALAYLVERRERR